jgi:hypothetical protein
MGTILSLPAEFSFLEPVRNFQQYNKTEHHHQYQNPNGKAIFNGRNHLLGKDDTGALEE